MRIYIYIIVYYDKLIIKVEEERRKEKSERNVNFINLISGKEVAMFIEK